MLYNQVKLRELHIIPFSTNNFNEMKPELRKTADGSHTLYVKELKEHYHSTYGAITEAMHIFINSALLLRQCKSLTVFEAGFGTGLNCLLTALEAGKRNIKIYYIGVDLFPLDREILSLLNYPQILKGDSSWLWDKIHNASWNQPTTLTDYFYLHKVKTDLALSPIPTGLPLFDIIYFDAFAPNVQPEMWESGIFKKISERCNPGAVFSTYSSKGQVRRNLATAGFTMEKLPGPPGKKEILRGIIAGKFYSK